MNKPMKIWRDEYFWASLAFGGFFLSLTLWFGFTMDQALYAYGAWVWKADHLPPYVGAWDLSFPGIFIVHRLVITLFGESMFGFRFFDMLVQLGSVVMIFYLARRISGSSPAGFFAGVLYGIYYFSLGPLESGEREGFILFLFLAALIPGLNWKKLSPAALVAGLMLGFAFLLKPTYGLAWPVFAAWFLARKNPGRLKAICIFAAGCIMPVAAVILYYWRLDHLRDLYDATLYFNFKVYSGSRSARQDVASLWLSLPHAIFMLSPVIVFFGLVGILARGKDARRSETLVPVIIALVSLASYFIQAKYFPYHLIPLFGMLAVFAGCGIVQAGSLLKGPAGHGLPAKIFYILTIVIMLVTIQPELAEFAAAHAYRSPREAYESGGSYDAFAYRATEKLGPYIGSASMEYFGWHPLIPYLLHKKLPSRFCVVYQLLMRGPNGKITDLQMQWINEYTRDVISARPQFFLVSDQVPGWDVFNLESPSLEQAMHDYFPALGNFLIENYERKGSLGEIEVYELKGK